LLEKALFHPPLQSHFGKMKIIPSNDFYKWVIERQNLNIKACQMVLGFNGGLKKPMAVKFAEKGENLDSLKQLFRDVQNLESFIHYLEGKKLCQAPKGKVLWNELCRQLDKPDLVTEIEQESHPDKTNRKDKMTVALSILERVAKGMAKNRMRTLNSKYFADLQKRSEIQLVKSSPPLAEIDESLKNKIQLQEKDISPLKLKEDRNSFYRCIAQALTGNEEAYKVIKLKCGMEIAQNWERYEGLCGTRRETLHTNILNCALEGIDPGPIQILAVATFLQTSIWVSSHDNGKSLLQELQSHIAYNPLTCETTNSIVLLKICSETETQDPKFQFAGI